jgi:hypothetical protein
MSNKQLPIYFTPKGRTNWLKIFKPDTKFDVDGFYGGKLVIDNSDAPEIMGMLDAMFEKAIASAVEETGKPANKIRTTEPYEVDQETGDITLKFKLKAKITTKSGDTFAQKPKVVDAKTKPITTEIPLWNGSLVRVGFQVIPYYTSLAGAGLSLRMKSVQVLEALAGTDTSTADFVSEEGYDYSCDTSVAASAKQPEAAQEYEDDVAF